MTRDHIHTPDDGRGLRRVFLDGKALPNCVYADTKEGLVEYTDDPPKLNDAKDAVVTHRAQGEVRVEFI